MKLEKQSRSYPTLKSDKGVAGLTILLSVVAMIFIIGFLVMVFAIIGSELGDNSFTQASAVSTNESLARATQNGINLTVGKTALNGACGTLTLILNGTNGVVIAPGNVTQTGCLVQNATNVAQFGATWLYTYPYTYSANNTATGVIDDTTTAIAGVTSWFPIIITITVMVALILLTVIIIVAIRSSGILAGGN